MGSHPSLAHSPESLWRIQNPLLLWVCHRRGALKERRSWPLLSPLRMAPTVPSDLTVPLLILLTVGGRALMPCKTLPWCFYSTHLQSSLWRPAQSVDKWLFCKCGAEGGRQAEPCGLLMNFYGFLETTHDNPGAGPQRSPNTSSSPFPHQAQLPGRPSIQSSTVASSVTSILWELQFYPNNFSSENATERTMANPEKKIPFPLFQPHSIPDCLPCPIPGPELTLSPLPPCPPILPGHMAGDRGIVCLSPVPRFPFPTCSDSRPNSEIFPYNQRELGTDT